MQTAQRLFFSNTTSMQLTWKLPWTGIVLMLLGSLDPADYPRLPLFAWSKDHSAYLNQVFWRVYKNASTWQSLASFYRSSKLEDIEALAESEFAAIAVSPSREALPPPSENFQELHSENFQVLCCLLGGPGGCVPLLLQHRRPSCHRP